MIFPLFAIYCRYRYVMYLGHQMEFATKDALLERPLHPYTQALDVIPRIHERIQEKRILQGDVPSPNSTFRPCIPHALPKGNENLLRCT